MVTNLGRKSEGIFRKLTRLFKHGPSINISAKYESDLRSSSGNMLRSSSSYLRNNLTFNSYMNFGSFDRLIRYSDFANMEYFPEINAALDIYADEVTCMFDTGEIVQVYSKNDNIKKILEELLLDRLNLEFNLWSWARNLCKFGDMFLFNDVHPKLGVIGTLQIPVNEVERYEGMDKNDPYAVKFRWLTQNKTLENWQVTHFRIMGNDMFIPYGSCHKYDTRIYTESGIKEIKDIKIGDRVWSFDLETQRKICSNVLDVVNSGKKMCYKISTKHNFVEASKEHMILVYDEHKGFEYKSVSELKIGDLLTIGAEHNSNIVECFRYPVISIEESGEHETYDIYVENNNHNFFANGIVTHNSLLEGARRIWRQLVLLEDAVMVYRIIRSPERRVFYIDVGNIPAVDVPSYMEKVKSQVKRAQVAEETAGRIDLRYPIWRKSVIPLLDGRDITIESLANEISAGKTNWVYSVQDGTNKLVPGKVTWCGKNYGNARMLKVTLDDGSYVVPAPEHPFILRDGTKLRADELVPGMSLMPFYRKKSDKKNGDYINGYEKIYDPSLNDYVYSHKFVANNVLGEATKKYTVVHHKDCNKINNYPDNLEYMNFWTHKKWHMSNMALTINSPEQLAKRRERIIAWNKTEEKKKIVSDCNKRRDSTKYFREYNGSELHRKHNKIRSEEKKKMWKDEERRRAAIINMTYCISDRLFDEIVNILKIEGKMGNEKLAELMNGKYSYTKDMFREDNAEAKRINRFRKFNKNLVGIIIKEKSGSDVHLATELYELIFKRVVNHKVVSVEEFEIKDDVYCMTVEGPNGEQDRHNFATLGFKSGKQDVCVKDRNSGILLGNSALSVEDDFYIPIRGDRSSKIDTLPGGQFTGDIEDLEYFQKKLFASLKIPRAYLGYEESLSSKCLSGETKIPLLSGEEKTIKEIAELFGNNAVPKSGLWVYSYEKNADKFVPGKIVLAEKTRLNAEVVEVELDNGEKVVCTPDHKFVLRGGKEMQAQDLKPGDSLQACYRKKGNIARNANDYEMIYQPGKNKWVWTHKMVDENLCGKILENGHAEDGRFNRNNMIIVHHKDFNRFNNSPDNLVRMKMKEHIVLHSKNMKMGVLKKESIEKSIATKRLPENRLKSSLRQKERIKENPDLGNKVRDSWAALSDEQKSEICKEKWNNHPELREKRSELNRELKLAEKMMRAYKEKFPNGRPDLHRENSVVWVGRPTIEEIKKFAENYPNKNEIDTVKKLAKAMGWSLHVFEDAIRSEGYDANNLINEMVGWKKGRRKNLTFEDLSEIAAGCKTNEEVYKKSGISRSSLRRRLNEKSISRDEWRNKYLGSAYNHKVVAVRRLDERIDTYNMEVECDNSGHNFVISSGIVLKNSTLSSEDVRFGRTIQRIQRILTSELSKVAVIHLYSLGFEGNDLLDFDIRLNNPSIIAEQQNLEVWRQRLEIVNAATQIEGFLPSDYLYKKFIKLSDREIVDVRKMLIDDQRFRKYVESMAGEEGGGGGEMPFPESKRIGPGKDILKDQIDIDKYELGEIETIPEDEEEKDDPQRKHVFQRYHKTGIPDFQRMASSTKDGTLTDPYDKNHFKDPFNRAESDLDELCKFEAGTTSLIKSLKRSGIDNKSKKKEVIVG